MPTATAQPYDDEDDDLEHSEVADHLDSIIRLRSHQSGDSYWGDPNNIQDRPGERLHESSWTDYQHASWRINAIGKQVESLAATIVVAEHKPRKSRHITFLSACHALHECGYSFRDIASIMKSDQENARRHRDHFESWRNYFLPKYFRSTVTAVINSRLLENNSPHNDGDESVLCRVEAIQAALHSTAGVFLSAAQNAHSCRYDPATLLSRAIYEQCGKIHRHTDTPSPYAALGNNSAAISRHELVGMLGEDLIACLVTLVNHVEENYEHRKQHQDRSTHTKPVSRKYR